MRISDWSSDVCSSDLSRLLARINQVHRHFLVEWEQPLDAELRAQGLELPPALARIGTEHVRAGEVERADNGEHLLKAVEDLGIPRSGAAKGPQRGRRHLTLWPDRTNPLRPPWSPCYCWRRHSTRSIG